MQIDSAPGEGTRVLVTCTINADGRADNAGSRHNL